MSIKKQTKNTAASVKTKVEKIVPEVKEAVEVKVVPEVKKVVEEKLVSEVKEAAEKATEKVKKATAKKEIKTTLFVEYYGKQVQEKDMIASVKKAWTKSGKKVADIKTMALYVKPEENSVYYVINGDSAGRVEF